MLGAKMACTVADFVVIAALLINYHLTTQYFDTYPVKNVIELVM